MAKVSSPRFHVIVKFHNGNEETHKFQTEQAANRFRRSKASDPTVRTAILKEMKK